MLYVVCTKCSFLRAFSQDAQPARAPESCPACGGEMLVRQKEGRFPPVYVSKASLELLATPTLEGPAEADLRRPG